MLAEKGESPAIDADRDDLSGSESELASEDSDDYYGRATIRGKTRAASKARRKQRMHDKANCQRQPARGIAHMLKFSYCATALIAHAPLLSNSDSLISRSHG